MQSANVLGCVILIVCLLTQQFHAREIWSLQFRQLEDRNRDDAQQSFDDFSEVDRVVKREQLPDEKHTEKKSHGIFSVLQADENSPRRNTAVGPHRRQKRVAALAVLFGVALATTLTNIGLTVAAKINGCCSTGFPKVCKFRDSFEDSKDEIERISKIVDQTFLDGQIQLGYVQQSNLENAAIFNELKRIAEVEEEIIKVLDADALAKLETKLSELRQQIREGNQTVIELSFEALSLEMANALDTAQGRAFLFVGLGGLIAAPLMNKAIKAVYIRQTVKFIRTNEGHLLVNAQPKALKVLGVTDIDLHIKQTGIASGKASFASSKTGKLVNAASVTLLALTIGMDLYNIINHFKQCNKIQTELKKAADKMADNVDTFKESLANVTEFKSDVFKSWDLVRNQTIDSGVHELLREVRNLTLNAASQTERIRNATASITAYLQGIHTASESKTFVLQKNLFKGLQGVKFLLVCLRTKLTAVNFIINQCSKGVNPLKELFKEASKLFDLNSAACSTNAGTNFTTEGQVAEIVRKAAVDQGFQHDCILNSETLLKSVCDKRDGDVAVNQIAQDLGLTVDQVTHLISKCAPKTLSPIEKNSVCKLFGFKVSIESLAADFLVSDCEIYRTLVEKNCGQPPEGTPPPLPAHCTSP